MRAAVRYPSMQKLWPTVYRTDNIRTVEVREKWIDSFVVADSVIGLLKRNMLFTCLISNLGFLGYDFVAYF